jgi:hypothetical protein
MRSFLPALAVSLLLAPPALAAAPPTNDEGATVEQRGETRVLKFGENEEVEGVTLSPDHDNVTARPFHRHGSMIKLRTDFVPQLIELSHDI